MKKAILSIVIFIVSFAVVYLIMCYLPGMKIKLSAEPIEYFVENFKHNMSFKVFVSSLVGLLAVGLSFILNKRTK